MKYDSQIGEWISKNSGTDKNQLRIYKRKDHIGLKKLRGLGETILYNNDLYDKIYKTKFLK